MRTIFYYAGFCDGQLAVTTSPTREDNVGVRVPKFVAMFITGVVFPIGRWWAK